MQRSQSLLILGIAVFLGLIAVFLANTYLSGREKQTVTAIPGGMVKIAVARVPLEFGTPVTPQTVSMVDWPASSVPEGAFRSISELTPMGKIHVALRPMVINEPVLRAKLSGEGGRASLSQVLKPDMRAAAVRVNDVASVAGFVLPGDVVDVLITRSVAGADLTITDVLLQNVRVIAIDQDANDTTDKPNIGKTATLEVRQVDAQKLALAQQVGSLSLVLRNAADQTDSASQTVGIEDLRESGYAMRGWSGGGAPAAAPVVQQATYAPRSMMRSVPAAPKGPTVQIVRGIKGSSYEVGRYAGF
jgi:pilus assembly protein CpaB